MFKYFLKTLKISICFIGAIFNKQQAEPKWKIDLMSSQSKYFQNVDEQRKVHVVKITLYAFLIRKYRRIKLGLQKFQPM